MLNFKHTSCDVGQMRLLTTMPPTVSSISLRLKVVDPPRSPIFPTLSYSTQHQVYFQCNATQFFESLDHTGSWHHHQNDADTRDVAKHGNESEYGSGVFRNPKITCSKGEPTLREGTAH
jgi:hypothetical protein